MPFEGLGAFEMYLLGMWSDGMVVTMKGYNRARNENHFILLLPDGSEQMMIYSVEEGFKVKSLHEAGKGRFAYLLEFLNGLEYKGYRGYEEYDEKEKLICGVVTVREHSFGYAGKNFAETKVDFMKIVEEAIIKF